MLRTPRQRATQPHPCLSFTSNPAPIHALCEDEGADWEHQGRVGGRGCSEGLFSASLTLVGTGDTSVPRALGVSKLSGEQHASEEPFHLNTPSQRAASHTWAGAACSPALQAPTWLQHPLPSTQDTYKAP